MAGDACANAQVGASLFEQFADFGVDAHKMGQRVKDRSLSSYAAGVYVGASIDIGGAIEEETSRIKEAVFGGDVEEGGATQPLWPALALSRSPTG